MYTASASNSSSLVYAVVKKFSVDRFSCRFGSLFGPVINV